MTGFTAIDLSKLPPPNVIETVDYDALVAEMKAEVINHDPELAAFVALESEPVTKLLRTCAYFRMLDRLAFNDGARACMLALASGSDLDQLAAFWGVERLEVQAADDTVEPAIPAINETDEDFRRRVQLSLEAHTTAGSRGAYVYWALSVSGDVRDVAVESPSAGQVVVTVLANTGNGVPDADLLTAVETALNAEEVRPLTDLVTVQAATILNFEIEASLTLLPGPDAETVEAAAFQKAEEYVHAQARLGHDITLSGIYAALHQPGVQNVALTLPVADLVVADHEAPVCTAISIAIGGRDV